MSHRLDKGLANEPYSCARPPLTVISGPPDPGRRTAPLKPKRTRRAQSCDKLEPDRRQPPDPTGASGVGERAVPLCLTWHSPHGEVGCPCPGNRTHQICPQQEPVSQEQTDSHSSTLPSPPLNMCLTRTHTPTHPPPAPPGLLPTHPRGQDGRMRCGDSRWGTGREGATWREGGRAWGRAGSSPGRVDLSLYPQGLSPSLYKIKKQTHCLPGLCYLPLSLPPPPTICSPLVLSVWPQWGKVRNPPQG